MARILVIDDHDTLREGMTVTLTRSGHTVSAVRSGADGLAAYKKGPFDLVVTDLKMDGMDGIAVTRALKQADPGAVVMVVTAFGTIETAVQAMQEGAYDFITKPFPPEVLRAKVDKGLELSATRRQVERLTARTDAHDADAALTHRDLVGDSEPLQKLLTQVRKVAASDATVLVRGESGTGKELVARMIHQRSPRKDGPFVVVHCAALAETLLESELFGHERGSFTGAVKRKLGRFELADGGTLFLDEIGEIPASVQTKLLRVLQEKELQRVGGEETLKVDVRVVSATHRDLQAEVKAGRFREDLYYRLHIVPLTLPPLRERPEDLPALARHFVAKHAPRVNRRVTGIDDAALHALTRHAWPGNVRELENVMEQALVFAEGETLTPQDLPSHLAGQTPRMDAGLPVPQGDRPLPDILEDLERQLIARAYEKAGGVKTETARLLGIKTSALYYKLEKYGFLPRGERPEEAS
ncbi:sigma-54-dependent Fis family transcriptional regulator [Corallococcus sp. AB030]|uniref:sigma-54-dependent transcriptional regulator n=1 Tax=Corallococcus TaxID=83461 RepID=UPI000EA00F79|nr:MULTISPECIES: sigma-54 dependent transcriptional regulator [Corallococcus]NRD58277.1 sigma-54-dependent Fis family transcriptional regulator [Corallococcus exiguus]RKH22813.1 sigma-54-dependent Fis family transcriptional regulator [Corallococcus sp. CA041A]RKI05612.1 sigma-54-dependent Fis family transcriptional regulator [Corallococcus sp. AB030]RUO89424.1 sigma-54-dependent Fis family transcriptional regulator [Corallococcus sp. AB018]